MTLPTSALPCPGIDTVQTSQKSVAFHTNCTDSEHLGGFQNECHVRAYTLSNFFKSLRRGMLTLHMLILRTE